jgi:uncharacterized protein (TIGR03437 family)
MKPAGRIAFLLARAFLLAVAFLLGVCGGLLRGQDTRTVAEPSFPPTCITLAAQLTITAGEPSSETAFDTTRIESALNACASGEAVELAASGNKNAFLIAPMSLPTGVTLLVDGGVTVFASRNPADYQNGTVSATQEACGTVGTIGNGCGPLIKSKNTTGSGIMGYGVVDGRGEDNLIVNGVTQSYSWYSNALQAYTTNPISIQNNPDILSCESANNFTLYKITIRNSPHFNVHWSGTNGAAITSGLTVWDIKIIEPYTIPNTDGIDPTDNATNVTIANSSISNGDDQIAIGSDALANPVTNVSVTNVHTYSGRGVSIGSETLGGIGNVLVDTVNQAGYASDPNGNGFRIKSAADRGGLVQNVTFRNICQQNETYAIRFYPFYTTPANTGYIPTFTNIAVRNVTILAAPGGGSGSFTFQGYDANHITSMTLDNLNVAGVPDVTSHAPENVAITLGPGPVNPPSLQKLTGPGVAYTGSITDPAEAAYPCSAANFPPLTGELYASSVGAASLTLNAIVERAAAEYPEPTSPIAFYEGTNRVGTAVLGGNGTLATLTLSGVAAGIHTYTAQYPADSNFAAFGFGPVTVNAEAPPVITYVRNAEGGGTAVASNTWVEIDGSGLSPAGDSRVWQAADFVNGQMPAELDGVSVTMNGEDAYLYYISPSQLNVLAPPNLAAGPLQVKVTTGGTSSAAFTAQAQAESPAFFIFGAGPYVAGTHANGTDLGPATLYPGLTTPAAPGETVALYANGFGPVTPPVAPGSGVQAGSLPSLPAIRIGGFLAAVQYAGLISPGLYQFNVVVPASVPSGDNPITAQYNGLTTQAGVLLTVQQ